MIGQVEFYEKAGFQNILSERCYEYLVGKGNYWSPDSETDGYAAPLSANVSCKRGTFGSCLQKRG